jgi:DNA-binding Xre family transcriptional regulator
MTLGLILRDAMLHKKVSARRMAKQIGVDHVTLGRFTRGRDIRLASLSKIVSWALSPQKKDNGLEAH